MKHIVMVLVLLVAIDAFCLFIISLGLLQLPIYFIVSLRCYGLLIAGVGLIRLATCITAGKLQKNSKKRGYSIV
ncbi:hypothetical protein MKW92_003017 [Papaver armeniacum]|nr:hypothetical protein MKW92_003017 [Papaver armeniacum]